MWLRRSVIVAAACLLATVFLAPSAALAQSPSDVDAAVAAYEEGDLEGAVAALDRAEEAGGLSREDFVRVVAHRLLVAQAQGDEEAVSTQALRLASLDPDALGDALSPQLERTMEQARSRADGVVRIEVEHEAVDEGVRVRARIRGDVGGLVQEVRLRARSAGGDWMEGARGVVVVPDAEATAVEVVAEAMGPANVILAFSGSEESPTPLAVPTEAVAPVVEPAPERRGLRPGGLAAVIISGVLVVAGVVTLGLALSATDPADSQCRELGVTF